MELTIRPVCPQNRHELSRLRVLPAQEGFIESVEECLSEADALPIWRPVGLYHGDIPVGFAMYGLWTEEGENGRLWLDRLLIDAAHQGQGYAAYAMEELLRRLKLEYAERDIYLSVYSRNIAAIRLYERFGFFMNGETDAKGEKVMVHRA